MGITEDLMNINLYQFLNCEVTANDVEIRKAFRKKSLACHPDKHPNNPKAVEMFKMLNGAVEILTDKKLRGCYDRKQKYSKLANRRRVIYNGLFDITHIKEALEGRVKVVSPDLTNGPQYAFLNTKYIARRGTPPTTVKLSAENLRCAFLFKDVSPNIQFSERNAERRARIERLKMKNASTLRNVQLSSQKSTKQSSYANFPPTSRNTTENDPTENVMIKDVM